MSKAFLDRVAGMSVEEKKELVKKIEETARDNERMRKGCCRNVLDALQVHLGLGNIDVFKAAGPLGGGVSRKGEACGALLGGLMAIGLAYCEDDRSATGASDTYQKSMTLGAELCNRFKDKFGGFRCWDVQTRVFGRKFDLNIPEEAQLLFKADEKAGYVVIAEGARLAAEVILGIDTV